MIIENMCFISTKIIVMLISNWLIVRIEPCTKVLPKNGYVCN